MRIQSINQSSFLPISDHNAVVAHVRLLGRFAHNHPVRRDTKPSLNQCKMTADPQLWKKVVTAVAACLRALPSRDTSVDARETAFATATLQAAATLAPQRKRTTLGHGWSGDAQTEAELSRELAVRRIVWLRLESDKRNSQLRREVRRASKEVQRVRTAAKDRFLERYVEELEEEVRKHNQ